MKKKIAPLFILAFVAAWLAGCGSEVSTPASGSAPGTSTNQVYNGFILGRVKLDRETSEGPVEIVGLDGTVLHSLQADRLGWFKARGELPVDFRVRARRGSDVYWSEIRGGWPGGTLYVNAATTLASVYWQSHPGLQLYEVEDIIHRYLQLPAAFKLSWVSTINCPQFNTQTFMANVRRHGLTVYLDSLTREVDNPIRLLGLASAGLKLADYVAGGLISSTVNDAVGCGVSKMGFNFTTAGALTQLQEQLAAVSNQITALSNQVSQADAAANLQSILLPLKTNAGIIDNTAGNISAAAAAFQSSHGDSATYSYNTPTTYDGVVNVTSQLQNLDLQNSLQPIINSLAQTSSGGLYQAFVREQMTLANLEGDTAWNGYPWRYNTLTKQQAALFGGFLSTVGQGQELVAEYANLQTDLAAALVDASNQLAVLAQKSQVAAQQVPDLLPSDELILDLSNQVMWVNQFYAPDTYANATDAAANLVVGPYDDFIIPDEQMLETLVTNRVFPSTGITPGESWGDVGGNVTWPNAFANIGFNTANYTYGYLPGGDGAHEDNEGAYFQGTNGSIYWWNDTGSNPSTEFGSDDESWTVPYLICRQFPGEPELNAPQENSALVALSDSQTNISPFSQGSVFVASVKNPSVSIANTTTTGIQLKATQFFGTGFYQQGYSYGDRAWDITYRASWTSSNTSAASVSNLAPPELAVNATYPAPPYPYPGPAGWVVWHPSLTGAALPAVNITASLFGITGDYGTATQVVNGTITLQPPSGLVPVLNQVNLLPVNQVYDIATSGNVSVPCSLTAYYADGQIQDVSTDSNTTWTLKDANGNVIDSSTIGGFGVLNGSTPNSLLLTNKIPTTNVTISATYAGRWGTQSSSGTLGLVLGDQNPIISKILPDRGSVAGGTAVVITGTNLGTTTSVTVGGNPATFFVATDTQLSVTIPSATAPGTVPVVITTSSGSSQGQIANFTYTSP